MTYRERVYEMAKKLSQENDPYPYSQFIRKGKTPAYYMKWGSCITRNIISARVAVSSQAQAIRDYLNKSWGHHAPNPDNFLIENGYMPPSECEHVNSSWSTEFMSRVCDDCGHKLPEDPGGEYAMGPGH